MNLLAPIALACCIVIATQAASAPKQDKAAKDDAVQLGNFSVSLNVKDIKASKAFYEKLDFKQVSGVLEKNWVVMQNGSTKIGLFQGMFEKNSLTFNPGWDSDKNTLKDFQDVRELQQVLKQRGLKLQTEAKESTDGPAFFSLLDPDGNPILVDQHVPKPKR
jgi:catechol 2,3-dioxygenase-like lactoylglutathione lyase family enzyme